MRDLASDAGIGEGQRAHTAEAEDDLLATHLDSGAGACGHLEKVLFFVGRAVENNLNFYIGACKPVIKFPEPEEESIPLRDACVGTPYSQEYLSLLARLGRNEATQRGRNWYTPGGQ